MVDDKSPPDTVNNTQQIGFVQHNPTLSPTSSLPGIEPNVVVFSANGAAVTCGLHHIAVPVAFMVGGVLRTSLANNMSNVVSRGVAH